MKNKIFCVAISMAIALSPGEAVGAHTVDQYLSWDENSRSAYMMGLVDVFHHLVFFPPSEDANLRDTGFNSYDKCIQDKSYKDIRNIIEKYVKVPYKGGHKTVSSIFLIAMEEDCKRRGFDTKKYLW